MSYLCHIYTEEKYGKIDNKKYWSNKKYRY